MGTMTWYERLWLCLVASLRPYLISPIGKPCRPRIITASAANRPRRAIMLNRYPRQIIGLGVRLPEMDIMGGRTHHPYLSLVWAKPHGSRRWRQTVNREVRG